MASFQSPNLSLYHLASSSGSEGTAVSKANSSYLSKFSPKPQEKCSATTSNRSRGFPCVSSSRKISLSWCSSKSLFSIGSSRRDDFVAEDEPSLSMMHKNELEFNRVNCLVWVLHESARSFSLAIQTLESSRNRPELSNAWNGVDVNAWHKRIAYQVAVYALLKAAIEVELFLSHKRCNIPVYEILSLKTLFLGEFVENQLNAKNPDLVHWFRSVELPRIAGLFIPLFQKWSVEYAGRMRCTKIRCTEVHQINLRIKRDSWVGLRLKVIKGSDPLLTVTQLLTRPFATRMKFNTKLSSGVAGVIIAISCCTAVKKLGSGRISCPQFTASIDDALVELKDLSRDLVSVDKLHHLAIEAGFEEDFLSHFGKKVLPSKNIEDVEFWIGLVQKKLSIAFHRESVITANQTFINKVEETSLATLGIFAYLGRETRLYLSEMNIKDIDDQIKDFLSYLECGSLYIHPEFNSLPKYQLFIEVVIDEIGWLDFYAPLKCKFQYDGRSRQHAIQAEKEIILYTVLTVCYDVFSGFAHYSNSSQRPLASDLLSFMFRSQTLLSNCLEEYWAAYDKSGELMKFAEQDAFDSSMSLEAPQKPIELMRRGIYQEGSRLNKKGTELAGIDSVKFAEREYGVESKALHERILRESTKKLISASNVILMGTQLLFIDVGDAFRLLMKQSRGKKITSRERRKLKRTLNDIITLVPVTILMLIPVSAVGHAAILAAINKYIPALIPSPYSSERLNLVRQLKRTKKMEAESWAMGDGGQIRETTKESEDGQSLRMAIPYIQKK